MQALTHELLHSNTFTYSEEFKGENLNQSELFGPCLPYSQGANQISILKRVGIVVMNWNTKAKTRAGRGRSKDDIENQQRLAAWNKLPKRKTDGKPKTATVESNNAHFVEAERSYAITAAPCNQYSDDLLMLGSNSNVSKYGIRDNQMKFGPSSSYDSPPKPIPCDDPLFLLELTVYRRSQSLIIFIFFIFMFSSIFNFVQPEKIGRDGYIRLLSGIGDHNIEVNC